jgi:dipeptidyl aminopeptidase/acylaminoacyl peptidase
MPASGGEPREIFSASNVTYTQWSPDGKAVAFTRVADGKVAPLEENMPELVLVNPKDGTSRKLLSNVSTIHRWMGDSKSILAIRVASKGKSNGHYAGKLVKVDVAGGDPKPLAALVGGNKMFFQLSPDGAKGLFTAVKAGKPDEDMDANAPGDAKLHELTIATGAIRAVELKASFAIYSPNGTKVLVGSDAEGGDGGLKLAVFDAGLAKGVTVATDAAKSAGEGPQSVDVYPGWLDEGNVLYLRLHAVYGKDARNFELISVDAQGVKRKNHQRVIENNLKEWSKKQETERP